MIFIFYNKNNLSKKKLLENLSFQRKIDSHGRISIPKPLRTATSLEVGDSIKVYIEGSNIILSTDKVDETQEIIRQFYNYFQDLYNEVADEKIKLKLQNIMSEMKSLIN